MMKNTNILNYEKKLNKRRRRKVQPFVSIFFKESLYCFLKVVHKLIEIIITITLLPLIILVFFILLLRKIFFKAPIFKKKEVFGMAAEKITIFQFNTKVQIIALLPLFLSVIKGDLSITGTSLRTYNKDDHIAGQSYLFNLKPGIFNLWFIRKSSKITHMGKFETDWEYVYKRDIIGDFLILLKTIPAFFYHNETAVSKSKINLFGIDFLNLTMNNAIDIIDHSIKSKSKKNIFFVNPDCLNKIFTDKEYYDILNKTETIFPDGIGINIASKMINNPLVANVNGTDLLPFLCNLCVAKGYNIFLLGGKPGIAKKMQVNLEKSFTGISIVGINNGYFDRNTENDEVINKINRSNADIVLVAFGAPLQEKWIFGNSEKLNPSVLMGVGGLFDFYSDTIKRAPIWMREIGLEWFFRLIQEPGRMWRRYIIGNPVFIIRILKWKINRESIH